MRRLPIIFLLVCGGAFHVVAACGTSTHISIAHEATTFFQGPLDSEIDYASIIRKHQDAFVAGNPYPDAMYPSLCFGGKYHDVAEDTHWAPFLDATVKYIQKNYPQPWDEQTEKLVAFVFGFVSHQVADISWHSLAGFTQGFLRTMANVNFHGVFDTAHTDGDVGGDMLIQFDKSDKIVSITEWYVPVDDLYQIYKEFYKGKQEVPKDVIELCSELLYIEYIAETFAGAKIFKPFVKKAPFLLNQLDNYFLGGIHDMAAWTAKIWNETAYMLKHGTDECNMQRSTMHINCTGYLPDESRQSGTRKNPGRLYTLKNAGWNTSDVEKVHRGRGVYFAPGEAMMNVIRGEIERRSEKQEQLETTKYSYSQTGKTIIQMDIDEKLHVAIAAPTYSELGLPSLGKVWIIPAEKFETGESPEGEFPDLDAIATQILTGQEAMSRFGWAMDATRYNSSSFKYIDLLVSAPIKGAQGLQYKGAVYVFHESPNGIPPVPNITLTMPLNATQPPQHAHTNYGFLLTSCAQSYELIASPFYNNQKGYVYIPETGKKLYSGQQDFSWFGYSHDMVHINVPQTYISLNVETVGSPNYRVCHFENCTYHPSDIQAVGQMTFYNDGENTFKWTGTEEFEELGYSSAISRLFGRFVAISSPGKTVKTTIDGIPITLVQAGKVSVYYFHSKFLTGEPTLVCEFVGDRAYGRFGDSVQLADVDGDWVDELIVGAPRRTTDLTEEFNGGEEGAVFIYKIPKVSDEVQDPITTNQAYKSFIGEEPNARFGETFQLLWVEKKLRLLVAATTSSKYGFKSGLIHSFLLRQTR